MVKPMRIEATAQAGRTVEIPLEIRNIGGSDVSAVELSLAEISQNPDGSWKVIEPGTKASAPQAYSSLPWTSLSTASIAIAPLEPAEVMVRISPPSDARGAYLGAILAETPAPEAATGILVRMRFLIPIIIQIEGRPARQQVALSDVLLNYVDGSAGTKPTTTAALKIVNEGRTYSRVKGYLNIERKNEDRWRPVTRFEVSERPIIPGMMLELGKDIERRLSSGVYRLRGELSVDGRRIAPIEKEINFEGDPAADKLAYDTALLLTPALVEMDILPGATRTTILRIENPGVDPVKVQMTSSTPAGLSGVAMGELLGQSLSAEPWTEIVPADFTIRPGSRQNVRVLSRIPKDGVSHPNYYGDLVLKGTYADGQSAGETRSTVHLSYGRVTSEAKGVVEQLALTEGGTSGQFFAQMRLTNIGNVHVFPSARVAILNPQGRQLRVADLAGDDGPLLPLGKRTFSSELDLNGLEPGYYALRATARLSTDVEVSGQQILLIETAKTAEGSGNSSEVPSVTIVDPETKLPDGIEFGANLNVATEKDRGSADPGQ